MARRHSVCDLAGFQNRDVDRIDADLPVGVVFGEPGEARSARSSSIGEPSLDLLQRPLHREHVTVQKPELRVGHRAMVGRVCGLARDEVVFAFEGEARNGSSLRVFVVRRGRGRPANLIKSLTIAIDALIGPPVVPRGPATGRKLICRESS